MSKSVHEIMSSYFTAVNEFKKKHPELVDENGMLKKTRAKDAGKEQPVRQQPPTKSSRPSERW